LSGSVERQHCDYQQRVKFYFHFNSSLVCCGAGRNSGLAAVLWERAEMFTITTRQCPALDFDQIPFKKLKLTQGNLISMPKRHMDGAAKVRENVYLPANQAIV
jgi:hypothetical protein